MQRVTESTDVSNDTMKYNRILGGAAIHLGDPRDLIFKLEGALKLVPKTESENGALSDLPKSTSLQAVLELMTNKYFVSYLHSQKTSENFLNNESLIQTFVRYGLGFKFGGMTIGFYRNSNKAEISEIISEYDTYQATIGYSFL